eukprot:c24801_g2_i1 orf=588-2303(-)
MSIGMHHSFSPINHWLPSESRNCFNRCLPSHNVKYLWRTIDQRSPFWKTSIGVIRLGQNHQNMGKLLPGASFSDPAADCSVAAMTLGKESTDQSNWIRALTIVEDLQEACATPVQRLRQVADAMTSEMHAGLAVEGGSDVKMLLTFVDHIPSGDERGLFYALDLGGTNFRVLRVQLGGKDGPVASREVHEVSIPPELMVGTTEELFDFIAGELTKFVSMEGEGFQPLPSQTRELGFTFSFPVKQISINSGILIKWTKGFTVAGTAGRDIVQVLNEALERQGLDMRVTALVNDTVGTLAVAALATSGAGDHGEEEVLISVILGTGTNACYVEQVDSIPKWKGPKPKSGHMVINMEWGGFCCSQLPKTQYDDELDEDSVNPGEQIFEKLLSGLYLGDLVRRVLLRLAEEAALFGEKIPPKLLVPLVLGTPLVSAMHQDNSSDLQEVGKILETVLGVPDTSLEVRKLVVRVCNTVTERAARLAAAGIVGILQKIRRDGHEGVENDAASGKKKTIVAMDGGLYEHYALFRQYLQAAVVELLGEEVAKYVIIELSKDGSGIGAALLAAAHSQYLNS